MGSLCRLVISMLGFFKATFLILLISCYTILVFLLLSVILLSNLIILQGLVDWSSKWLVSIYARKTQIAWFDHCNSFDAINAKLCVCPWLKNYFKMLWLSFYSKFGEGSYIVLFTKIAPKKIGALILCTKFFFFWGNALCP